MAFFQPSVLNKHLKTLDKQRLNTAYAKFIDHFHNPIIQENIRNSKEEQYQGEFLIDLFVNVLGYTKNPAPGFNLTTEYKNIKDSKKADGAIIMQGAAAPCIIAVIELKGTNTTDLSKVEDQAFGYKNNQPECVYVVISNFEKLRFYIDNAIEHLEFNLFTLTYSEFELLYLCLGHESIEKGLPKKIKEESLSQEDQITKKLYNDYSLFKRELHQNLVALNPQFDALTLFKKSQKLLDRFLFLFFAEDRQLLPPNSVRLILNDWRDLQDRDVDIPLYARFKKYFEYLNTGFKGKRYDVFAYNGGLFKPDQILDTLTIENELLYKHALKLSAYDFVSEVDVNILGHIFENSLNELDEIKARLEGLEIDKSKTKRKKDGVFYTPKYITKYIVDNTIGKLCSEKKTELLLNEEEYTTATRGYTPLQRNNPFPKKEKLKQLEKLTTYRDWLLQLTVCDPACGSGAFLNQALNFLINEHRYIDELQAKLFGDAIVMSDLEKSILENNLFGVDFNEESVEIAKLSLWLRTAQPNRKLNDLNNNIKCGNSLIDDRTVAGDKAFNWQKEFPQIFKEKEKRIWHITTVTHDTRTSQRMIDYHVRARRANGEMHLDRSIYFNDEEAIQITAIICNIIIEDKLNCLAYNVCNDHVHLILVCEKEELQNIVRKLKGKSAQKFKEYKGISKDETFHLWAQKFNSKEITDEQQLANTINYIQTNRDKHELSDISKGLQPLVTQMTCTTKHAFRTEYTGGFDVVIGNPPYVQLQSMGEMSDILKNCGYETFEKGADLYCIFTERGYTLLKHGGMQSFIMPNKWMLVAYGKPLRKFLSKTGLRQVLNFGDIQFFQEATTYVCIFVTQKSGLNANVEVLSLNQKTYHGDFLSEVKANLYDYPASRFDENEWSIQPFTDFRKLEQMKLNGIKLKDLPISIYRGILTGYNEAFYIDEGSRDKLITADAKSAELIKPMLRGRDIAPYAISGSEFLINVHNGLKEKNPPLPPIFIDNYPAIKKHLDAYYPMLEKRGDKGDTPYNLRNCAYLGEFSKPKIIYPNMTSVFPFMYDESGLFSNDKSFILTAQDDSVSLLFLTALLNSSLAKLWIWYNCPELQGGTREIRKVYFEHFPVPRANEEQTDMLSHYATERTRLTAELETLSLKFQRSIQRRFETIGQAIGQTMGPTMVQTMGQTMGTTMGTTMGCSPLLNPLPGKLQNWYLLTYPEFIKELVKKKIKLTLAHEAEWEEYFLHESKKALALKTQIETTDKEIDGMVYELYGLTEEEINIVEAT